jgi:hypothetical protein
MLQLRKLPVHGRVPHRKRQFWSVLAVNTERSDADHRVVPFRRPHGASAADLSWRARLRLVARSPVEDLAKYEQSPAQDDYRHRMKVNLAAFAVTVVLIVAGVWIAAKLAEIRTNQDCYLAGRRNCTPIKVQPNDYKILGRASAPPISPGP